MVFNVKQISTEETIVVRHPVLRKGRPREDCYFAGDDNESTFHLGVFDNNQLMGVATFLENNFSGLTGKQMQLRGMAVLENYQGKGLGAQLLKTAEEMILKKNIYTIWCNARIVAVPFYEKLGYRVIGDSFIIPEIGIHFVMFKLLTQNH
jgi:GNAT superfamily N-acetyltransferase